MDQIKTKTDRKRIRSRLHKALIPASLNLNIFINVILIEKCVFQKQEKLHNIPREEQLLFH